jgi:hypothetical protein
MGTTQNLTPREKLAALVEQHRRELSERLAKGGPLPQIERPALPPNLRGALRTALPQPLLPPRLRRSPALAGFALIVAVTLFGACALGGIGIASAGFSLQGALSDPTTTAETFYAALHGQEYAQAYTQLSPAAQTHISQADFVSEYSDLDAVAGVVESYTIDGATTNGASASVTAQVVRRLDATRAQEQQLTLIKSNGSWHIDGITLGQTGPAPGQ